MVIDPIVLFAIQFTFVLVAYALLARWYVWPRLSGLPPVVALVPLIWVHVFRIAGGSILAPGSVGPGVPAEFREVIGYGDMATAVLALARWSPFEPGAVVRSGSSGSSWRWACSTRRTRSSSRCGSACSMSRSA
jgi:hypothetical protein